MTCDEKLLKLAGRLGDALRGATRVPVRQWVLSRPHWLRDMLAWDHGLCRAELAVYVQALLGFQRRQVAPARCPRGPEREPHGHPALRRSAQLNIHFHTLVLDGVFTTSALDLDGLQARARG